MAYKINIKKDVIDLTYGAGGKAMHHLLEQLIFAKLNNEYLAQQSDQAILPCLDGEMAFTTDSYVVSPYFFPGGDIGRLAVSGTVNDLAVGGATPLYLSLSFILEEGFLISELATILDSIASTAKEANVAIVTGDLKVVEKGKGDHIFINMAGIGVVKKQHKLCRKIQKGDRIIVSGNIAEHGIAVMASRANLSFGTKVKSDTAPLNNLILPILDQSTEIRMMRDPTRGGVGSTLNEWSNQYNVGFTINESDIPITDEVMGACELLGLDPLYIANEGKVLLICSKDGCGKVLDQMRQHPYGINARDIGEVTSVDEAYVNMCTTFGGTRKVDWLNGEQLPRIC